jgi:scyllo-inosamine-4-phosphate amidinotransferase 1
MNKINSHTEWGTLKEVILGRAEFAQIPKIKNHDIHCVDYANYDQVEDLPGGYYPQQVIDETVEDLDLFQSQLENIGVKVIRPELTDSSKIYSSPHWTTDGYYSYCPRDSVLIVGETMIETPMPLRARYYETFAFRKIFKEYMKAGSGWISAPKPELLDDLYDRTNLKVPTLTEFEPAFDAANIVKCGKDLFYLLSNSGNRFGAQWLQQTLGSAYRVHVIGGVYAFVHLDTTIMPLAPGVVLLNPNRVNNNNLPEYFKTWKKIWCTDPVETPFAEHWAPASPWLGMNVLSISEKLVAVESRQTGLIRQLESEGFDIMPVQLRHCRTLSGGPHCATLDTVREDHYDDYS